ncbi:hypothetical protein CMU00_08845 [Elizabethkingia anophelis]|nr:hypothetical protein [Elizabethkingia anophelis]
MNWLKKIFDRIEISNLFSYHLATFYHYEKKIFYNKTQIPKTDKLLFLVFPIFTSVIFVLVGLKFDKDYLNIILTSLSIFTGLLFTLLTMILGLVQENNKIKIEEIRAEDRKKIQAKINLTKDLFINIAFSVFLSILAIIFVLATQFYPNNLIGILKLYKYYNTIKIIYIYIINCISFFLLIEFILTLLMIIKRFSILFINQTS